jgi:hypothetical protein
MKGIVVAVSIVFLATLPSVVQAQYEGNGSTGIAPAGAYPTQNAAGTAPAGAYSSQRTTSAGAFPSYSSQRGMPPSGMFSSQNSQSQQKKQPGPLRRLLHSAADEVGGTAAALIGATIGDADIELPPDTEQNPSWPFSAPRRKALYTVYWTNGTTAKISKSPEGTYSVTGGGHAMTLQKESGGVYALLGEDGSMGTLTPRMGGGYTLMKGDGTTSLLLPRPDGGFNVVNEQGNVVATIIPGPGGSRHVFSGNL